MEAGTHVAPETNPLMHLPKSINGVRYELLTKEHGTAAVAILTECFLKGEPTAAVLEQTREQHNAYFELVVPQHLDNKLSVAAVDASTGRLVGCFTLEDFATMPPSELASFPARHGGGW